MRRAIRRWVFRVVPLLAMLLLLAAWVTSYFAGIAVTWENGRIRLSAAGVGGLVCTAYTPLGPRSPDYLKFYYNPGVSIRDWNLHPAFLGFDIGAISNNADQKGVVYPFWVPLLLLAALTWFAWRKTRPAPRSSFPVLHPDAAKVDETSAAAPWARCSTFARTTASKTSAACTWSAAARTRAQACPSYLNPHASRPGWFWKTLPSDPHKQRWGGRHLSRAGSGHGCGQWFDVIAPRPATHRSNRLTDA